MSPPMRGRGLKPANRRQMEAVYVAPHAGAWIETGCGLWSALLIMSPPMRGRGLKHVYIRNIRRVHVCRPPCGGVD